MKILIDDTKKIHEIQDEFNIQFPYLKLEFFSKPHKKGEGSAKNLILNKHTTLDDCRTAKNSGSITITPTMTVNEIEQKFNQLYGLPVQVFRKSGKVWLETTVTDNWTLEEQNKQGEALSSKVA